MYWIQIDSQRLLILLLVILFLYFTIFRQIDHFVRSRDPVLNELKQQLAMMDPNFGNIELYEGNRSYTINKKRVYICLKDENGKYYNRNMLIYVICHEYAHILCDEVGHTKKFFQIFNQVLDQATQAGLYNHKIPLLDNYCGVKN